MYRAVLDACVLVPGLQRDFLLQLASERAYSAHWGTGILFELDYVLADLDQRRGKDPEQSTADREHLLRQMDRAFPGAAVVAPKHRNYGYELHDPDDQHVVHAAVLSRADVLVTDDGKARFASCPTLMDAGIEVKTAGRFVTDTAAAHPDAAAQAVRKMTARKRRPPLTPPELLDRLITKIPGAQELHEILDGKLA